MAKKMAYLLRNEPSLYTKLDSSHSFGMTNNAVTSNEVRGLSTDCKTKISRFARNDKMGFSRLFTNVSKNRNTVEFLGIWAGLNNCKISVKEWADKTKAIGLKATAGRYGGTYAPSLSFRPLNLSFRAKGEISCP